MAATLQSYMDPTVLNSELKCISWESYICKFMGALDSW